MHTAHNYGGLAMETMILLVANFSVVCDSTVIAVQFRGPICTHKAAIASPHAITALLM